MRVLIISIIIFLLRWLEINITAIHTLIGVILVFFSSLFLFLALYSVSLVLIFLSKSMPSLSFIEIRVVQLLIISNWLCYSPVSCLVPFFQFIWRCEELITLWFNRVFGIVLRSEILRRLLLLSLARIK